MKYLISLMLIFAFTPLTLNAQTFDHSHQLWNEILQSNVTMIRDGKASTFNYKKVDSKKLNKYIAESLALPKKQVESMSREQRLAYFINLYNALTVKLILKKYPKIDSIKDFGGFFGLVGNPWKLEFFELFEKKENLDGIEHSHIRGDKNFDEPRIHVAVNCASIGCPALLNEAFIATKLNDQLETAMKKFLSDETRNYFDQSTNKLMVSPIFAKWYTEDFEKGYQGYTSLKDFLAKYATQLSSDPKIQEKIRKKDFEVGATEYDWKLNDTK